MNWSCAHRNLWPRWSPFNCIMRVHTNFLFLKPLLAVPGKSNYNIWCSKKWIKIRRIRYHIEWKTSDGDYLQWTLPTKWYAREFQLQWKISKTHPWSQNADGLHTWYTSSSSKCLQAIFLQSCLSCSSQKNSASIWKLIAESCSPQSHYLHYTSFVMPNRLFMALQDGKMVCSSKINLSERHPQA